jgi:hypothetical protein
VDKPGRLKARQRTTWPLPKKGKVKRYFLTCAQNNTGLHEEAWESLLTLAEFYDAEIIAARFTYGKTALNTKGQKTSHEEVEHDEWWDARLEPYFVDHSVEIAPGLVWCGELQILPTAVNPLSGLESYTGRASAIIPHVTFAVQSVASPKHQGCKFLYTTGTVTLRNYIQKKAGQKAEFNHGYGALLVEVRHDGSWFPRQLNADSEGVIYDLDHRASGSRLTHGHRPEAVVLGDVHRRQLDPEQHNVVWGKDGLCETLRPRRQVVHDVLDFRSGNHHDRKDPWKTFEKHVSGGLSVEDEVRECAEFIAEISRPWCETVVVPSNHDEAMIRWLKEVDFREDPANARFFLDATVASYEAMATGQKDFYPIEWAFRRHGKMRRVKFLRRDEEYVVCADANGGIELGMHGDVGANGSRGSLPQYAKTGRKTITGHSHSAGLRHGAMSVGVTGSLDMGYNRGMSSWSHTHALVYPNGKRTLITVWQGRWRA